MKQKILHGGTIDAATSDELRQATASRVRAWRRIRAPETFKTDATGRGTLDIYKVPAGMQFEARRIVVTYTGNDPAVDANTNNTDLTVAGRWFNYTRSGQLIEIGQPAAYTRTQIPGAQNWGEEQGPYLRGGEVFGINAGGLIASTSVSVYLEGILTDADSEGGYE